MSVSQNKETQSCNHDWVQTGFTTTTIYERCRECGQERSRSVFDKKLASRLLSPSLPASRAGWLASKNPATLS